MGRKLSYKLDPHLLALLPLCLGVFLGALDQTVVVTALPSMIVDLQVPFQHLDQAAWIVTGYLLGYTVAMPLVGRLSDVYGRRRLYLWCLVAFFGGSLLAARAGDLPELVLARVVQATGGGGLLPVTLAIASDIFPDRRRTLALGFTAAIAEAGGVIGPLYGAAITNALGWRWVFYINLPLAPIIGVLVYRLCRESQAERERIDFGGAATLSVALAALTLGLSQASGEQSVLPEAVGEGALVGGLVLLALFVWMEARRRQPLIDVFLFRRLPFSAANLTNFLFGCSLIIAMVDIPLYVATIRQGSPLDGGLMLIRLTALIPVGAVAGGYLSPRAGYRPVAAGGLALSALGLFLISSWTAEVGQARVTLDLALAGLGFGLIIAPITATAVAAAGQARAGTASALVTVMRMVGMMAGLAALTSWGLSRFNHAVAGLAMPLQEASEATAVYEQRVVAYTETVRGAIMGIYSDIFLVGALLCLVAIIPVLLLNNPVPERATDGGANPGLGYRQE